MNSLTSKINRQQRLLVIIVVLLVVALIIYGIAKRLKNGHDLQQRIDSTAVVVVETIKPGQEEGKEELMLPGDVQAFADAPIYARTSGYLKRWLIDIGTHVKRGQLLAEIDVPELDQQLLQARADLANARANAQLATSTAERWKQLLDSDSVSKQDADEKISDALAKKSLGESASANVERLKELQLYKNLVAPFDGVVTARNIDIGALVNAGSGVELFRVSASDKLRVYVDAPQYYAPFLKPGLEATLDFAERPGQKFTGKLVRTAEAIDASARTLRLQFEVDNANGELLPGSYAQVHLQLNGTRGLRLPINTLIFRGDGLMVATVNADQHVVLKTIVIGRDYGTSFEVASGVGADDAIIINPPDSIVDNQQVRLAKHDDVADANAGNKDAKH
ncbi:MAG: efflux transporter periplasmic adaptor subunit [Verrucomicrobiaceae bacterium]|nr:efflux transporter periplasmic adaptor subunit [Verrucomicrobiaceae bacterium]